MVRDIYIDEEPKDIIAAHVDCSSSVYASKYRDGVVPSRRTAKMNITPADLKTFPSLLQFEQSMPADELRVDLSEPNLKPNRKKQKEQAHSRALWSALWKKNPRRRRQNRGGAVPSIWEELRSVLLI